MKKSSIEQTACLDIPCRVKISRGNRTVHEKYRIPFRLISRECLADFANKNVNRAC